MSCPPTRSRDAPAFLVERYLSSAAAAGLPAAVARVAELCAGSASTGHGVQYLQSAYLPSEDTCFCLFRAPSSEAVTAVNAAAGFAFDRITDAILLESSS